MDLSTVFVLGALSLSFPLSPLFAQDPATLAAGFVGMNQTIDHLEQSGHNLIQAGNAAVGQQQIVIASTIHSSIEQMQKAYSDSLTRSFSDLDSTRQNNYRDLQKLLGKADDIRSKSVADAQALIYMTAGQTNALLGRLPFAQRYPVYFGTITHDILASIEPSPVDFEILGFYFTDPKNPSLPPPTILIDGQSVPQSAVGATDSRLRVKPHDDLKRKLGMQSTCDIPKSHKISIEAHWTNWPTLSKLISPLVSTTPFNDFVFLNGVPQFDVAVDVKGKETIASSSSLADYSTTSEPVLTCRPSYLS